MKMKKHDRDFVMQSIIPGVEIDRDSTEKIKAMRWHSKDKKVWGETYIEDITYRRMGLVRFNDKNGSAMTYRYPMFFAPNNYLEAAIQFVIRINQDAGLDSFYDLGKAWKDKVGDLIVDDDTSDNVDI